MEFSACKLGESIVGLSNALRAPGNCVQHFSLQWDPVNTKADPDFGWLSGLLQDRDRKVPLLSLNLKGITHPTPGQPSRLTNDRFVKALIKGL